MADIGVRVERPGYQPIITNVPRNSTIANLRLRLLEPPTTVIRGRMVGDPPFGGLRDLRDDELVRNIQVGLGPRTVIVVRNLGAPPPGLVFGAPQPGFGFGVPQPVPAQPPPPPQQYRLTDVDLAELRATAQRVDTKGQEFSAKWGLHNDVIRELSPILYAEMERLLERFQRLSTQYHALPGRLFLSIAAATAAAAELNRQLEQLFRDINALDGRLMDALKQHYTQRINIRNDALQQLNDQIVAEIGEERWPQISEHAEYRPLRLRIAALIEPHQAMGRAWQGRVFATPQEMRQEYDRIEANAEEMRVLLTQLQGIARRLLAEEAARRGAAADAAHREGAALRARLDAPRRAVFAAAAAAVEARERAAAVRNNDPRPALMNILAARAAPRNRRGPADRVGNLVAAAAAAAPPAAPAAPAAEACAIRPAILPQRPGIVELLRRFPNQTRHRLKDWFTDYNKILRDRPAVWGEGARGYQFGLCPVCVIVHESTGGCKYHYDPCRDDERDEHLWNKYSYRYRQQTVEFCFTCGRPSRGHGHYPAVAYDAPKGEVLPAGRNADHYAYECANAGGGNRKETIARILGIIEFFNSLNPQEPITIDKAFKTRMARAANDAAFDEAKLRAGEALARRPAGSFPEIRDDLWIGSLPEEAAKEPVGWFIPNRPPKCPQGPDGRLTHTAPVRIEGQCCICADEGPVYRFKHNNSRGVMYTHTEDQLICMSCTIRHIISNLQSLTIQCFINSDGGCGGTLHPCEFQMIRDQPIPEDIENVPADIRNGEDLFQRLVKNARAAKLVLKGGRRRLTKRRRKLQKKARKHTHKKPKRRVK